MRLSFISDNGILKPDKASLRDYNSLKNGKVYECEIKQPRNFRFHRKFFALLNAGFEMQEKYDNFEDFRVEVELKCGNYREHITTKGEMVYIPKSISFAQMDDIEFESLYSRAIDVIMHHFVDCEGEDMEEQVNRLLTFV